MGDNEAAIINVHEFMAVVKQRDGMPRDKKGIIAVMLKAPIRWEVFGVIFTNICVIKQ